LPTPDMIALQTDSSTFVQTFQKHVTFSRIFLNHQFISRGSVTLLKKKKKRKGKERRERERERDVNNIV